MESTVKTIAKTKRGNFEVTAIITVNSKTDFTSEKMTINLGGEELPVFLDSKMDRIRVSPEVAKWFGVEYSPKIALLCETDEIFSEKRRLHKESESNRFDGKMIDSGFGFNMKNTKQNRILVAKYGFDAIEKVK